MIKLHRHRRLIALVLSGTIAGLLALATPRVFAWGLSRWRPDIHFTVPAREKTLYLTIDDSPTASTAEILRVLKKHGVTATFFVIADRVRSTAELEAIVAEGHSLGNHLKTARPCSELSLEEFQHDFDACQAVLESVTKPTLFRPASGFASEAQIAYARSRGCVTVLGTVFPLDHWITNPQGLTLLTRWLSIPGGIVILHDGRTRGRTTASVLDRLIPQLRSAGYRIESLAAAFPAETANTTASP